jgi:predicted RNA binding protein YcfA (HicA-like mRNA interferase family)
MAVIDKLILRLKTAPKNFRYSDLVKVLNHVGYTQLRNGKTTGSARCFQNRNSQFVQLHEPHPSPYVTVGCLKDIIKILTERGEI